jgi:hypothetical protein
VETVSLRDEVGNSVYLEADDLAALGPIVIDVQ